MSKGWETFFKNTLSSVMPTGSRTIDLATKHEVPLNNGKFNVGAPGVMNFKEIVEVELQWASGFANPDKTDRFTQLAGALEAVEAYSNNAEDEASKPLYTNLNVYGRAMFAHIVNLKDADVKGKIFAKVNKYSTEGLDLNGTQYKEWTKVSDVFSHHVAPKIEAYKDFYSNLTNDNGLREVIIADDSTATKEEKVEKKEAEKALEIDKSAIANNMINEMLSKAINDTCISQSYYNKISNYITENDISCEAFDSLLNKIADDQIQVIGDEAFVG